MSRWWMLLAGALLSGPLWIALAAWSFRRLWRITRKLAARAKGYGQLVELGQLTGGLAHEIKNPLSTINVNLQLLAEDLSRHDDELHSRWLRRLNSVQDETNRLKGILEDFLQFAGRHELNLQTVDVRRLASELADFFTPQAEASNIILRTTIPQSPVRCAVDERLLKQAVLNLMINAAEAMPDGGELLIKVSAHRSEAQLEIIDTGAGIAEEELPRVFEAYYSTKKGGTGLGLPTTRRIVREHNGTIRVESEVGKGTRFIITLSLEKD